MECQANFQICDIGYLRLKDKLADYCAQGMRQMIEHSCCFLFYFNTSIQENATIHVTENATIKEHQLFPAGMSNQGMIQKSTDLIDIVRSFNLDVSFNLNSQ